MVSRIFTYHRIVSYRRPTEVKLGVSCVSHSFIDRPIPPLVHLQLVPCLARPCVQVRLVSAPSDRWHKHLSTFLVAASSACHVSEWEGTPWGLRGGGGGGVPTAACLYKKIENTLKCWIIVLHRVFSNGLRILYAKSSSGRNRLMIGGSYKNLFWCHSCLTSSRLYKLRT